ncbi:unnamed protein product [Brassica rapa subsp. narinosa]|uniref:(rape) hypothetical protein n=1 Tax=Brassica napus TaxID=3708 RepID=A0A817ATC7_BRANA|nr:unnamed protein product [Brassica napus]
MNCLLQHPDHAHKAYKKRVTKHCRTVLETTVDTGKCRSPQGVSEHLGWREGGENRAKKQKRGKDRERTLRRSLDGPRAGGTPETLEVCERESRVVGRESRVVGRENNRDSVSVTITITPKKEDNSRSRVKWTIKVEKFDYSKEQADFFLIAADHIRETIMAA